MIIDPLTSRQVVLQGREDPESLQDRPCRWNLDNSVLVHQLGMDLKWVYRDAALVAAGFTSSHKRVVISCIGSCGSRRGLFQAWCPSRFLAHHDFALCLLMMGLGPRFWVLFCQGSSLCVLHLRVWSFVRTSVLYFFFSCSLAKCFSFIYLFIYFLNCNNWASLYWYKKLSYNFIDDLQIFWFVFFFFGYLEEEPPRPCIGILIHVGATNMYTQEHY